MFKKQSLKNHNKLKKLNQMKKRFKRSKKGKRKPNQLQFKLTQKLVRRFIL